MASFILLTAAQADAVRGSTAAGSALDPAEREGGVYLLPVAVLADPAHEAHHDFLAGLPTVESSSPEFPAPLPSPDDA